MKGGPLWRMANKVNFVYIPQELETLQALKILQALETLKTLKANASFRGRKKKQEEVIPEDPITHPANETEEATQEQEEVVAEPVTEESQQQGLFNE